MSEILIGLSGQQYTITDHIKSGGEGGVYNTNLPEYVAKLYDISKTNIDARMAELGQKLTYMVNHPIPTKIPNGMVIVTWPQDILYRDGKFVGYIMPKVSGAKPIYMLNRGGKQANEVIPGYNWKIAVSVAVNLTNIVEFLHSRNVVIGDMNSDNLLVYPDGFVVVIDTDSFDITDDVSNKHYKCSVGTEEFLPPELQGRNLERENASFTKHTDEFALAIHIFQLLMNNMHPFNVRVITDYKQSLPENNQNHNIMVGNCPFVRKIDGCTVPLGAPDMNKLLPDYLVEDFKRTFDYQLDQSDPSYMDKLNKYEENRTPVADWHRHLEQLAKDPGLVQCQNDPEHYYLAVKGHCELCEAKKIILPQPSPHKKFKFKVIGSIALVAVFVVAICLLHDPLIALINYKDAMSAYNEGNYGYAANRFADLGDYKDSYEMWQKSLYNSAVEDYNVGRYIPAARKFESLGDYKDSHEMSIYGTAMSDYDDGSYESAAEKFESLGDYRDSYLMWQKSTYGMAMNEYEDGSYKSSAEKFKSLGDYKDSYEMWQKSTYRIAMSYYDSGSYESAAEKFESLGDYQDSYEMWQKSMVSYIDTHYNNSDNITYKYVEILDSQGYDIEDKYHELYDWRVERAFVNTDSSDTETELDYVSRSETWWTHFLIKGGTPEEELHAYLKRKSAGDSSYRDDYKEDLNFSLRDGSYYSSGWYYKIPSIGETGTWVLSLFDAETDKLLGSATVEIIE